MPGPQTVSHSASQKGHVQDREKERRQLTFIQSVEATSVCELVCADDASEDGEERAGEPPADGIAEKVDLFAGVVVGPERDTT